MFCGSEGRSGRGSLSLFSFLEPVFDDIALGRSTEEAQTHVIEGLCRRRSVIVVVDGVLRVQKRDIEGAASKVEGFSRTILDVTEERLLVDCVRYMELAQVFENLRSSWCWPIQRDQIRHEWKGG